MEPSTERRSGRFLMQALWPAFLTAAFAEGLIFSLVDPHELTVVGVHLGDSREAAYTAGFFVLWALFSVSSALTFWLARAGREPPPQRSDSGDGAGDGATKWRRSA